MKTIKLSARPARREDNAEFVARLMNVNPTGALCQAFILEAIARYAKEVAEAPAYEGDSIVSGEAWKRCGAHIHREMEARLGPA